MLHYLVNTAYLCFDIEFQDAYAFSDSWRIVWGGSYRKDTAESQTFFGGKIDNEIKRAFFNSEYRFKYDLLINIGLMTEKD